MSGLICRLAAPAILCPPLRRLLMGCFGETFSYIADTGAGREGAGGVQDSGFYVLPTGYFTGCRMAKLFFKWDMYLTPYGNVCI